MDFEILSAACLVVVCILCYRGLRAAGVNRSARRQFLAGTIWFLTAVSFDVGLRDRIIPYTELGVQGLGPGSEFLIAHKDVVIPICEFFLAYLSYPILGLSLVFFAKSLRTAAVCKDRNASD
jgi:hypothetical protein